MRYDGPKVIKLHHFVAQHPHGGRLRKRRDRRLNAIKPALKNRVWYARALQMHLITRLRTAGVDVLESLRPHWPRVTDDEPSDIKTKVREARAKFHDVGTFATGVSTAFVRKNLDTTDERLSNSIKASLGVDVRQTLMEHGPILDEMRRVQRENVELITSIPEQYFDDLEDRLSKGWNAGDRWESMVDDVAEIGDVAENRAAFIARDQTNKANGAFSRVRQTGLGITRNEWQTAGDDLVRPSHAEMDGEIYDLDDPPLVDGDPMFPGDDFNCRCVGAPVVDLDEFEDEGPDVGEVEEGDEDFEEADFG